MWIDHRLGAKAVDKYDTRKIIQDYIKEICHYGQMQVFATSYYQSAFFQREMDEVTDRLISFCLEQPVSDLRGQQTLQQPESMQGIEQVPPIPVQQPEPQGGQSMQPTVGGRTFTSEELAFYDGSSGRPAYVAVSGIVYDVTSLIRWAGGTHFGMYAGKDLTIPFQGCHQGVQEVLRNVPKVGTLEQKSF